MWRHATCIEIYMVMSASILKACLVRICSGYFIVARVGALKTDSVHQNGSGFTHKREKALFRAASSGVAPLQCGSHTKDTLKL